MWNGFNPDSEKDPRVLKAQLDVVAAVNNSAWMTTPFWAVVLAWLGSDTFGLFGHRSFSVTLFYPVIVTAVSFAAYALYGVYRRQAALADPARLRRWFIAFCWLQGAISLAWGSLPWLIWSDPDLLNNLFILLAISATLSSLVLGRAASVGMMVAGTVPMVVLTVLRFVLGGSWIDMVFAVLAPLYALHLYIDGRRFIARLQEDTRLRFQVEDLAAALTKTRDEAVKKRYEAESASASKTAFLANMSHELRTPLNAILGFSDLIANQAMGPKAMARYSEYAQDIHNSGEHLLSLINDLLDVAKIEAGKMTIEPMPLDPATVIDHAARLMSAKLAEKNQQLTVTVDEDLPLVLADERALRQMLLNLLSNAAKFTQAGGHIAVSCKLDSKSGIALCVADDGPGIPAEKLALIFQPFSQIDNRYDREAGGTGLGLALVQGLVHLHGGRVWLESGDGKGVRAHLYFPSTISRPVQRKTA